jgi:beta-phosphoglucomutase-like phosphatase (HAD superfamily)
MSNFSSVIIDFDGTLFDTRRAISATLYETFAVYNLPPPSQERVEAIGKDSTARPGTPSVAANPSQTELGLRRMSTGRQQAPPAPRGKPQTRAYRPCRL